MLQIPSELIESLKELGLLESESKIYGALVLLHDAEVKEIQDTLGLSKPSIYEGLRQLETKGMIILTNDKPTSYQAIPPKIAIEVLLVEKQKARDRALEQFEKIRSLDLKKNIPSNLWYIFGNKHFESKIKDMLEKANESIFCVTSGRYLDLLEEGIAKGLNVEIIMITGKEIDEVDISNRFKGRMVSIHTIPKEYFGGTVALGPMSQIGMNLASSEQNKAFMDLLNYESIFVMIADDEEMFYIPPLGDEAINAITTRNKSFALNLKSLFRNIIGNQ